LGGTFWDCALSIYTYDTVRRYTKTTDGTVGPLTYPYDSATRPIAMAKASTAINVPTYDNSGASLIAEEVQNLTNTQNKTLSKTTMEYDIFNRMTRWQKTDGTGTKTETHTYRGAEWHRTSTTVDGTTTAFLYDNDNVIADMTDGSAGPAK
jgi:hypothetical protein